MILDKVLWLKRKASNKYEQINFKLQMVFKNFIYIAVFLLENLRKVIVVVVAVNMSYKAANLL